MKKAITYLRFSSDGQSQHSIERQQLICESWIKYNSITVIDTFTDDGYSARTFDRPDIKQLFSFINKNVHQIDYLVVSELTRFSRETGDAINMVKKIQKEYGIRIVSAGRSQVYDCNDSNSFFMMGLEFLLGNSENIKRQNDINGGIYTAKAEKGKYIGPYPPYGYRKDESKNLVIDEHAAPVVRFIYDAYLSNTPEYIIKADAKKMGFPRTGNDAIRQLLTNPVYMGHQQVKPYKDMPGGLFPLKDHCNIIDPATWYQVQEKLSGKIYRKTLSEYLPLRGLLKCHCGTPLTGAPSKGKSGKYFLYYKCNQPKHNNISAMQAHDQLQQVLRLLSLPDYMIDAIREESEKGMKERLRENDQLLRSARQRLEQTDTELRSVEQKWIIDQMPADTFHRWHGTLTEKKIKLAADIDRYSRDEKEKWFLLDQQLEKLTDMQYLYNNITTTEKQELLRQVFDNGLYYQSKLYRTPWMMETFTHNAVILKEKNLLIIDGWDYKNDDNPVRWSSPAPNRTLSDLLTFISSLKAA